MGLGEVAGGEGGLCARAAVSAAVFSLRARWKELDRAGGPSSRALWDRFDAALKSAYEPVAAQIDAQRARS